MNKKNLKTEKPRNSGTKRSFFVLSFFGASVLLWFLILVPASAEEFQSERLIDSPTAGLPPKANYYLELRMQPGGGFLGALSIGLLDRLSVGFSYGGFNIIGYGKPTWNPHYPAFQAKYRLFEESFLGPAIALGFDSQGYGEYYEPLERYTIKSKGFYGIASKNYIFLGRLSVHAGANYSLLEKKDQDNQISFFVGLEKSINPELYLVGEYDLAFNDDKKDSLFGEGKGYLNLGLRWTFAKRLSLEFDFKNILKNGFDDEPSARTSRILRITYMSPFS
ncbi:MAG: hypothetical protein AB1393_04980 [Candidatus Edwardsbacteria bacterium]